MRRIADGQMPLGVFLGGVLEQIGQLVDSGRALGALKVPGAPSAQRRDAPAHSVAGRGARGLFWSCSRYPECGYAESASPPIHGHANRRRRSSTGSAGSKAQHQ